MPFTNYARPVQARVEIYDPASGSFSFTGDMTARALHTGTLLTDGSVLITGGERE